MVRELDMSRITLRLMDKVNKDGGESTENVHAKLVGDTLAVLQQCLVIEIFYTWHVYLLTLSSISQAS